MNDQKRFRFVEFMRYGIDLARIFPIIINHRGALRLISGIYSHVASPHPYLQFLISLDYQLQKIVSGLPMLVLETIRL